MTDQQPKTDPRSNTTTTSTQRPQQEQAAQPQRMVVPDKNFTQTGPVRSRPMRAETDAEMQQRIAWNARVLDDFHRERPAYPLPPAAFDDLLLAAERFDAADVAGAGPNSDIARLVIGTLVTLAPPLRKAGSRRLAFDGARWTPDRAADRAAAWIARECGAILGQRRPTFMNADGSLRAPSDPIEFELEELPAGNAVKAHLARWQAAPNLAVDALYAALPDLGRDALREDPVGHLNTPAGVISLRDGHLTLPAPPPPPSGGVWMPAAVPTRDYVRCTGVVPAETVSQLWLDFLAGALPDAHVRDWAQRLCGYFATGSYTEDLNIWLIGETRTGKSTFTGALRAALGDYAYKDDTTALLRTQTRRLKLGEQHRGIRLLRLAEMEQKYTIDAARLKDLSGGDEAPGGGWWPQFTIMVETNHMPALEDHSGATGARMRVVRFDVRRYGHQIDPSVRTRLRTTEAPGVLRWMIDGAVRYYQEGLQDVPDAVREATAAVLAAQDPEGTFYAQLHASATPVPFTTLYSALVARCAAANKPVPGKNVVSVRLAAKGFPAVAGAHNVRVVYARLGDGDGDGDGDGKAA